MTTGPPPTGTTGHHSTLGAARRGTLARLATARRILGAVLVACAVVMVVTGLGSGHP